MILYRVVRVIVDAIVVVVVIVRVVVDHVIPASVLTHVAAPVILLGDHRRGTVVLMPEVDHVAQPVRQTARGGIPAFKRFELEASPVAFASRFHERMLLGFELQGTFCEGRLR